MPIRVMFSNRSNTSSTSAQYRVMIAPTVRQAIRISCAVALLLVWVASWSSRAGRRWHGDRGG